MLKIEMLVTFEVDTKTNVWTPVSSKIVSEKAKKAKTKTKSSTVDLPDSGVLLESNKLILSNEVIELLGAEPGDRISITYEKRGRFYIPTIGLDDKGNKLTKSNSISYRGKANEELSKYGSVFEIGKEKNGRYYLNGDVESEPIPEDSPEIEIDEDDEITEDLTDLQLDNVKVKEITTNFNYNDIEL